MMENYDPNTMTNDVQRVKVTFQQWEYKKTVETEVGGNCRGFDVLDCAIEDICNCYDFEARMGFMNAIDEAQRQVEEG